MPAVTATAPGKVILFGEHAVVYNRPAIAVPVTQVQAKVVAQANPSGPAKSVEITAPEIGLRSDLEHLAPDHPLALAVTLTAEQLGLPALPALKLHITATIPIASGMGSGAAVSVAIARALSAFLGHPLSSEQVSEIGYRVDQRYHGTPSGVDNTVITYAQPVFFIRGQPFERLDVKEPFTVVIGDTGVSSPTGLVVGDLRERWQAAPAQYERIFDQIGAITRQARQFITEGPVEALGTLMQQNHRLLQELDVSSSELDRLVQAALDTGALGAKLCGGGRGGNMIALVMPGDAGQVAAALQAAGAVRTIITTVGREAAG